MNMATTSEIITNFEAEQKNVVFSALSEYLSTGLFVDVSLVCKGQILRAHKVVLSSSSKYFRDLFRHQPNISIIDLDKELEPNDLNLTLEDIKLIIGILYCVGTVEISPQRIESLLVCSQVLGIPTLILFLKRIRDSISETKIVKDGQLLYYGGKLLGSNNTGASRFDLTNVSQRHSAHRRTSGSDIMYILSSPSRQQSFAPPVSQSFQLNPPPPPRNPPPPSVQGEERRSQQGGGGSFPMLDLSLVKPMTASCINSPESPAENNRSSWRSSGSPSPQPGPSGIKTRGQAEQTRPEQTRPQQTRSEQTRPEQTRPEQTISRSDSSPQPGPSSGVRDTLLNPQSKKQWLGMRRSASRISNSSYSSFTLNCLQSPQLRTSEDTQHPRRINSVSMLDGIDPNLLMQLNNLQANQLDDLENVLLPHLTSDERSCQPTPTSGQNLLDLPGIELSSESHQNTVQSNVGVQSEKENSGFPNEKESSKQQESSNSLQVIGASEKSQTEQVQSSTGDPTCSNKEIEANSQECSDAQERQNSPFTENQQVVNKFSVNLTNQSSVCRLTSAIPSSEASESTNIPVHAENHIFENVIPTSSIVISASSISTSSFSNNDAHNHVNEIEDPPLPHSTTAETRNNIIEASSMLSPSKSPNGTNTTLAPSSNARRQNDSTPNPPIPQGQLDVITPICLDLSRHQNLNNTGQMVSSCIGRPVGNPIFHVNTSRDSYTFGSSLISSEVLREPSPKRPRVMIPCTLDGRIPDPGVRLTPFTIPDQNLVKPVRLTPMGSVTLSPLKNLLAPNLVCSEANQTEKSHDKSCSHEDQTETDGTPDKNNEELGYSESDDFEDSHASPHETTGDNIDLSRFCQNLDNRDEHENSCANTSAANSTSGDNRLNESMTISSDTLASNNITLKATHTTPEESCPVLQEASPTAGPSSVQSQPSGEIIMNLDQVCPSGQRMKFCLPGVSQAVTLNFSAEALQEMKNAALRTRGSTVDRPSEPDDLTENEDLSNQIEEISSSRGILESEEFPEESAAQHTEPENVDESSNASTKPKKSRKNLRQKLKSNRTPKSGSSNHSDVKYNCTACNKSFSLKHQLIKHLRFHVKTIFSCEACCKIFEERWKYDKHMEEVHGKKEDHKCPECASLFHQASELMAHMHTCHQDIKKLTCQVCNLDFTSAHHLINHMNSWHPNSGLAVCNVCMQLFDSEEECEQHACPGVQIHSNKIVCHQHDKPVEFASRKLVQEHMKSHHHTDSSHLQISCYICHKNFMLKKNLWKHLRNIHNLETGSNKEKKKEFECDKCDKKFCYKSDLNSHMTIHTGVKNFKCTSCDRNFLSMKSAKMHARDCQQDFICHICSKKLSSRAKLKAHALTHTTERAFSCSFCESKFKEKRCLQKHIRNKHLQEAKVGDAKNKDCNKTTD